jgi:dTDP-4-dehydrorhamnose reductase
MQERNSLNVVNDQIGSPTYAADLAEAIVTIIIHPNWQAGIYHYSNEGEISWYEFAQFIFELAGEDVSRVSPVSSSEFPSKVERPKYSVLCNQKWNDFGITPLKSWQESATAMFPAILQSFLK